MIRTSNKRRWKLYIRRNKQGRTEDRQTRSQYVVTLVYTAVETVVQIVQTHWLCKESTYCLASGRSSELQRLILRRNSFRSRLSCVIVVRLNVFSRSNMSSCRSSILRLILLRVFRNCIVFGDGAMSMSIGGDMLSVALIPLIRFFV